MAEITVSNLGQLSEKIGEELVISDWIPVSQEMVNSFAEVTGDPQWIHVDTERAEKESPFGGTIAHGFLTVSLLVKLIEQSVKFPGAKMGVNYGFNRLRFTGPVMVGSKIRGRFSVNSLSSFDGGVQIAWGVVVESDQSEKPVMVAEWLGRRYE